MLLNHLIRGFAVLALSSTLVAGDPASQGALEGHLKIFPLSGVDLADDAMPTKSETEQRYSEYPLIIRSRDGKKEIARVTADARGNYRVPLPPGDYVLDIDRREHGHVRATARPFTILPNQSIRVDISIDTGIR